MHCSWERSRKSLEAGFLRMSSNRPTYGKRLVATAALAAFVLMIVGSGCRGFFVNQPHSVSVTTGLNGSGSSTFTITTASGTQQLFATATFDDGNKDVTNSASWQSSSSCATVSSKGLVTAVGNASSIMITATLAGVSGSATGTLSGNGTSQTLNVTAPSGITAGGTGQFAATLNGSDVTASSTWTSDNTSAVSFSTTQPGFATFGTSGQSANVTASLNQGSTCATGTLVVSIP
jgi:hypothetical protein